MDVEQETKDLNEKNFSFFQEQFVNGSISDQIQIINKLPGLNLLLGEQLTRDKLIPLFLNADLLEDETLQATLKMVPSLYTICCEGDSLKLLLKHLLSCLTKDEVLVRSEAIEGMKYICEQIPGEQMQETIMKVIMELSENKWFSDQSSLAALIALSYTKLKESSQKVVLEILEEILMSDSATIRSAAAQSTVDLSCHLSVQELSSKFKLIERDVSDAVRSHVFPLIISLAKKLEEEQLKSEFFELISSWPNDESWNFRLNLSKHMPDILRVIPYESMQPALVEMFNKLLLDSENEVRIVACKNLVEFCQEYKKILDDPKRFQLFFDIHIIPIIRCCADDENPDIKAVASKNILEFSKLVETSYYNSQIVPEFVYLLSKKNYNFIDTIFNNLHCLPEDLDLSKLIPEICIAMRNIIMDFSLTWRSRRSILTSLVHLSRRVDQNFFTKHCQLLFVYLVADNVFAIRRTAALLVPLFAKRYGFEYICKGILPVFLLYKNDPKYLYKYIPLYGINELVSSTLSIKSKHLESLKRHVEQKSDETLSLKSTRLLFVLSKLFGEVKQKVNEQIIWQDFEQFQPPLDNISFYAEELEDILKKHYSFKVTKITTEQVLENHLTYLEGLLLATHQKFMSIIQDLLDNNLDNIKLQAKHSLNLIKTFIDNLEKELSEEWVQKALDTLDKAQQKELVDLVQEKLNNKIVEDDETKLGELFEMRDPVPEEVQALDATLYKIEEESEQDLSKSVDLTGKTNLIEDC